MGEHLMLGASHQTLTVLWSSVHTDSGKCQVQNVQQRPVSDGEGVKWFSTSWHHLLGSCYSSQQDFSLAFREPDNDKLFNRQTGMIVGSDTDTRVVTVRKTKWETVGQSNIMWMKVPEPSRSTVCTGHHEASHRFCEGNWNSSGLQEDHS